MGVDTEGTNSAASELNPLCQVVGAGTNSCAPEFHVCVGGDSRTGTNSEASALRAGNVLCSSSQASAPRPWSSAYR